MLKYCRCSYGNVNRYQLQQNKLHNSYVNDNRYQLQQNKVPNFWTFVHTYRHITHIHIDISGVGAVV